MRTPQTHTPQTVSQARRNLAIAGACGALVASMVGAAYAAVPLYNWFCRTTGFAGTPQVAAAAPNHIVERALKIRFDANVAGGLPWKFEPEQNSIKVRVGEVVSVEPSGADEGVHAVRYRTALWNRASRRTFHKIGATLRRNLVVVRVRGRSPKVLEAPRVLDAWIRRGWERERRAAVN